VPTVRQNKDGSFIIRTHRPDQSKKGASFGTWQVHAKGEQYLQQRNLCHDGASISASLFQEMIEQRLIYNESGFKSQPIATVATRSVTAVNAANSTPQYTKIVQHIPTKPAIKKVMLPLSLRLLVDDHGWRFALDIEHGETLECALQ
jgi:hypothetical protein